MFYCLRLPTLDQQITTVTIETLNTLHYADRAKNIQNRVRINEDPKDAMLREFQKEIDKLKRMLSENSEEEGESEEESEEGEGGKKVRRKISRKGKKVKLNTQFLASLTTCLIDN